MTYQDAVKQWSHGATASRYKDSFHREENIRELVHLLRHDEDAAIEVVAPASDCGLTAVVKVTPGKDSKRKPFYLFVGV